MTTKSQNKHEQQQANTRQRLMDAKKNTASDVSAEQMLQQLRNETKKNRELCYDVLGREFQDKQERCQKIEMLLAEPITSQSDIDSLANEVRKLQRTCQNLEDKLNSADPADDNLAIYKTQAAAASKKKEINEIDTLHKANSKSSENKSSKRMKVTCLKNLPRSITFCYDVNPKLAKIIGVTDRKSVV